MPMLSANCRRTLAIVEVLFVAQEEAGLSLRLDTTEKNDANSTQYSGASCLCSSQA